MNPSADPSCRKARWLAAVCLCAALSLVTLRLSCGPAERRTEEIAAADDFGLKPGQSVAVIGCTSIEMVLRTAATVGERGKVVAVDADQKMLDAVKTRAEKEHVQNIRLVRSTFPETGLARESQDVAVVHRVLDRVTRSQARRLLRMAAVALKPEGRLLLIEPIKAAAASAQVGGGASGRDRLVALGSGACLTLDAEYFYLRDCCFLRFRKGDDWPQRKALIEALRQQGMLESERVTDALAGTPRHLFVPDNLRYAAYVDTPLPIGEDQTISAPGVVAKMTELLEPDPKDVVLEIGTGSGYQAAVLCDLVKHVYTIEILPSLADTARERLARLAYENVTVRCGDGYKGWPEHAPFDGIIVTCAPEHVPEPLKEQLKEGGRMVIPVGSRAGVQWLYVLRKNNGVISQTAALPVVFVPMTGEAEKR